MEVIEGGFKQVTNTIHQLQDDILDAIEKYEGRVTVAAVIGVLEIIKYDLLADVEKE
jgi:acyl-CoA synthetase (NDP forming)